MEKYRFSKWWPRDPNVGPKDHEELCIAEDELRSVVNAAHESGFQDSGLGSEDLQSVGEASDSKINQKTILLPLGALPDISSTKDQRSQNAASTVSALEALPSSSSSKTKDRGLPINESPPLSNQDKHPKTPSRNLYASRLETKYRGLSIFKPFNKSQDTSGRAESDEIHPPKKTFGKG